MASGNTKTPNTQSPALVAPTSRTTNTTASSAITEAVIKREQQKQAGGLMVPNALAAQHSRAPVPGGGFKFTTRSTKTGQVVTKDS